MKFSRIIKSKFKDQRGAVAVIVAVCMAMLIGFLALAIDVGYLYATKNELQNAADAAALAGAGKLGEIYSDPDVDFSTYVCTDEDKTAIRASAMDVVGTGKNSAGGGNISIRVEDIFIDNLAGVEGTFPDYRFNTNDDNQPDAVRVIVRRDSTLNGRISTFFAKIFNIYSLPVTADATAALTGLSIAGPGGLPLPVAINSSWMETLPCNEDLTFHPSSADVCSAWHSFTVDSGYNDSASPHSGIRGLIDDITDFTYESPETIAGVTKYSFTNATMASVFTGDYIQNLFNDRRVRNDGIHDMDENDATWTLSVPVYDDSVGGCNPNEPIVIVGFTSITITNVSPPPETTIYATVACDEIKPGRGGGAEFGTKGSIPGLIE